MRACLTANQSLYKDKYQEAVFSCRWILFACLFVITWLLFGFNTNNVDYYNYYREYVNISKGHASGYFSFGFTCLMDFASRLGLNYQQFLILIAFLTLSLFYQGIKHFTDNVEYTWLLYIIYPFAFDVVQYRNALAFAICLYAVHYLYKPHIKIGDYVCFFMGLALAVTIHSMTIVYLVFILFAIRDFRISMFVAVVFNAAIIYLCFNQELFYGLLSYFNLEHFLTYEIDFAFSTFAQYVLLYGYLFVLAAFKYWGDLNVIQFRAMIIFSMFLPFVVFSGVGGRFFRNVMIIIYAILSSKKKGANCIEQLFINALLFVAAGLVFYMQLGTGLYSYTVLYPVLHFNVFW